MQDQETEIEAVKNDEYYWNIKDTNGRRFSIPLLDPTKASYKRKYIGYMKLREQKPHIFEKILNWD